MSTIEEQIALEQSEIQEVNAMIIEFNNQVTTFEEAIETSNNLINQYNTQINECNTKIVELNESNMLRNDIISNLELLQKQAKISNKQKKGKK